MPRVWRRVRGVPMKFRWLLALWAFAGCGPDVSNPGGGGSGGASNSGGQSPDGGWTACSAPGGARVCKGKEDCPDTFEAGCACYDVEGSSPTLGACLNTFDEWSGQRSNCADGGVMVELDLGHWTCAPWELGMLFCDGGGDKKVRYRDFGAFDCAPLPTPQDCPTADGVKLCGDFCGGCEANETCGGRSKDHPYSFCMPIYRETCSAGLPCANADERCFIFAVADDPESQAVADKNGMCLSFALCEAAAANLPGGGSCNAF